MSKLIAVSIGDIKGIGIEILIKEWKSSRISNFVLITNYNLLIKYDSIGGSNTTELINKLYTLK